MTALDQLLADKDTGPSCSPRRLRDTFRNRRDQWPGWSDIAGYRIWVTGTADDTAQWEVIEDIASHCGDLPGQYDSTRIVATGVSDSYPAAWRDVCAEVDRRIEVAS